MNNLTYKNLSDFVTALESGGRPKGGGTKSGDIPSLGAEHLTNFGGFNFAKLKFIPRDYFDNMNKGIIQSEDILIVKDGATTGKVGIIRRDFPFKEAAVNEHLFILRLDHKQYYPKFLFYYLFSGLGQSYILRGFHGSAQGGITKSFVDNVKVPLIDIEIQRKIATILETCESAMQKRKEANRLTDEFLKSTFLEMFGDPGRNPKHWRTSIINDAVKFSEYGTSKKSNNKGEGYPIIGMGNITYGGGLDLPKFSYVELSEGEFNKLKLQLGDIIFNRTNSTELVGKTTYWNQKFDAVIASYLVKLHLKTDFNPIWFSHLLNTKYYKVMFMERCKKAVGQSNISPTLVKQFPMYMPPLSEQQKFADIVQKVEKLKQKQHELKKELTNLFNSLMQKAFGGEL